MKEFCQMHRINLSEINWYHLNAYLILKKGVKIQYKPRKENAKHLTLVRKTPIAPTLLIHGHVSLLSNLPSYQWDPQACWNHQWYTNGQEEEIYLINLSKIVVEQRQYWEHIYIQESPCNLPLLDNNKLSPSRDNYLFLNNGCNPSLRNSHTNPTTDFRVAYCGGPKHVLVSR